MRATLSSKGQVVLPAEVRRRLRLVPGESLDVELVDDAVVLRMATSRRRYKRVRHPVSGLPVMVAIDPPARKVTAAEIARLASELT